MTTQEIIDYYADLLIIQYKGKPKAYAHIQALVTPVVMDQLPLFAQAAFSTTDAIGEQLDILGKYAGVTRSAFGSSGQITLNDADFQKLILLAIIKNNAGSSLATIQDLLSTFFPDLILVFDYQNMAMSYLIDSAAGSSDFIRMIVIQGILPRPMGVQASIIYSPNIRSFFGYRTYDFPGVNISPFNDYDDYQSGRPWLTYDDAF